MKLGSGEYWYCKTFTKILREEAAILAKLPVIFEGINMLGGLTLNAEHSWLGYIRLKP